MSPKSPLDILDSVDPDVLQSYASFQAGVGPVADIMERIANLEPAERVMILDLWHRKYKSDGTLDKRRAVNRAADGAPPADTSDDRPPFDPPYVNGSAREVSQ